MTLLGRLRHAHTRLTPDGMYRLRVFGAGADGETPPRTAQVALVDVYVSGHEGLWVGLADAPCLFVRGLPGLRGAYHGGWLDDSEADDAGAGEFLAQRIDALQEQFGGLRVEWECVAAPCESGR